MLNEKTVLRAGYGRSHDIGVFGSTFGHSVTQNLPVLAIQNLNAPANFERVFNLAQGPPPPTFPTVGPDGTFPLPDGVTSFVLPFKQRLPRVDAWNVAIQRQLSNTLAVEIAYVGNRGSRTFAEDNPDENNNQATLVGYPDVPLNQRKPFFNSFGWTQDFRVFGNLANNSYHSLQAKATKRFSNGWSVVTHYTLQRVRQFANDYFYIDRDLNWGRPGWDRKHNFLLISTVELPFGRGKKVGGDVSRGLDQIIGGWQFSTAVNIASGLPFDVNYRDAGQDRDTGPNRPNVIGDPNPGSGDGLTSPYFNATPIGSDGSAFGRPARGTFGDMERNSLTGPGYWNVDASLFKRFRFTDRTNLEFRLEVNNVFNHVNLNNPDSQIGVPGNNNPNAGFITSVAPNHQQRNFQFALRFTF